MTSARSQSELGPAGLLMRADDFFSLGEMQERYELVNGVVVMSPSPRPKHWKIIQEILRQLMQHEARTGTQLDIHSEIDLFINDLTVYQPDLFVYARPPQAPERLTEPPDLVVEVVSPGSKPLDLITKKDAYENFGVKEYWAIDVNDGRIRVYVRDGDRFRESLPGPETLPSTALAGFELKLAPIRTVIGMR